MPAIAASTFILILGVLDDRFELGAIARLVTFVGATALALALEPLFVLHTLDMDIFDNAVDVSFGPFAAFMTLLIVVGFVNASDMADGINGQFLGSVVIWSLFLLYYLSSYTDAIDAVPYLVLAVSGFIALLYNLRGHLFSGSAGSYGASLFVGLSAIAAYRISGGRMPADVPLFWFYLPVLDCLRLSIERLMQKRSPFSPDRNHFHHILIDIASPGSALAAYLALLAAPGMAAIISHLAGWFMLAFCVLTYGAIIACKRIAAMNAAALKSESATLPNDRN